MIGLTAASDDAILVIIISDGEELTFKQKMGHDVRVNFDTTKTVSKNSRPGKEFPGVLTGIFYNKESPTMITCSTDGSITSAILCTAFECPMGLFDVHNSRLHNHSLCTLPTLHTNGSSVLVLRMELIDGRPSIQRIRIVLTE